VKLILEDDCTEDDGIHVPVIDRSCPLFPGYTGGREGQQVFSGFYSVYIRDGRFTTDVSKQTLLSALSATSFCVSGSLPVSTHTRSDYPFIQPAFKLQPERHTVQQVISLCKCPFVIQPYKIQ
jgi:hypothetical protein